MTNNRQRPRLQIQRPVAADPANPIALLSRDKTQAFYRQVSEELEQRFGLTSHQVKQLGDAGCRVTSLIPACNYAAELVLAMGMPQAQTALELAVGEIRDANLAMPDSQQIDAYRINAILTAYGLPLIPSDLMSGKSNLMVRFALEALNLFGAQLVAWAIAEEVKTMPWGNIGQQMYGQDHVKARALNQWLKRVAYLKAGASIQKFLAQCQEQAKVIGIAPVNFGDETRSAPLSLEPDFAGNCEALVKALDRLHTAVQ